MHEKSDSIELVRQARLGDRKSLEDLAKAVRGRLYAYVYRIVLRDDLAQDIVQETMLEMFKLIGNLEKEDKFWPWLRGIAFNKIRRHYAKEHRHRTVPISTLPQQGSKQHTHQGLANLVSDELKQLVLRSMQKLKPRHRKVLTMRCYEEMQYSEIAELMGTTEISARVLFCRAKKSLQRELSRNGFGAGALLTALVLFGKLTAPSQAAAANVSVTAATVKVGLVAGLVGMVGGKAAIVSVATAGALAVGTVVVTSGTDSKTMMVHGAESAANKQIVVGARQQSMDDEECWYYYPFEAGGPVMMRLVKTDPRAGRSYCERLQNEQANYYFDNRKNTIYINNHRVWRSDLSVWRLPADKADLRQFLSQVEGHREKAEYIRRDGDGLLVIVKRGGKEPSSRPQVTRHYNVLDEEYFIYSWPGQAKVIDNRDTMHKRGWTYFRCTGRMNGTKVSGSGRLPFVYAASWQHRPWLKVQMANGVTIADNGQQACVWAGDGKMVARYQGGSFFVGLGRPWMGLHTIDTVRRDAAQERLRFETRHTPGSDKAQVLLTCEQGKLVYTIDLETDVIDKIKLSPTNGRGGELIFSYLQDVDEVTEEFTERRVARASRLSKRQSPGVLWPMYLAEGSLGQ